ncbi:oxidoreductase [Vibrio sp. UCD-FRSSP16_10]|uniref:SDR family oxidoreductase n=1 Tax=unclassified Vibrio TaxID=2614977 RepID=UPI0007FC2A0A|nr:MULTISPECIES: SDR family oxidoreductase [unclassified Vibrio]OBT08014.1 oxidoreductase [Vibrio sp. UCD-FRSSP16_30]OBT17189.1 oxidoreductase [Vibrio sp. UCD-FRSSP16_10]
MSDTRFGPQGWTPERIGSLKGKTYVITGATSGTGFEASKILLSKGAKVVMLNRNSSKSNHTISLLQAELGNNIDISFVQVDLGSLTSVKQAADELLHKVSQIDALICNGAIAQVPKQVLTEDGFESQLGVNHYGHFLLQGLLFPMIDKSSGRIVTVGSEGYKMGIKTIKFDDMNWDNNYTANKAYSQSKLAQIMSVYELQQRLATAGKNNVKVYACHPGSSRTSLITTSGNFVTRLIFGLMTKTALTQTATKGAYPELMCALEPKLDEKAFYGPTGFNYFTGPVGECELASHALNKTVSTKLWQTSEKTVNFSWHF